MTRFKQVREAARNLAVRATGDDGEEAKLNDLPSDQSQQDDADENNRNPDGTAEDQVEKSIKPIYTKTENGVYTLNTESVDTEQIDELKVATKIRAAATRAGQAEDELTDSEWDGSGSPERAAKLQAKSDRMRAMIARKHGKRAAKGVDNLSKIETGKKPSHARRRAEMARAAMKGARNESVEIHITENTIDDIKKLTTLSQAGTVRFADGSSTKVSPESAHAILQTHGNLNTNNQKKFAKKLSSSASEFAKLEKFSLQQAKLTGRLYQLNNL